MRLPTDRREIVRRRAKGLCEYCLCPEDFAVTVFSVEHIQPRSAGGTDDLNNLAFACQACNNYKYTGTEAIDPLTGTLAPLYHPRSQRWTEHFEWSRDFTVLVGISHTGRATVQRLRLNRQSVVNIRWLLRLIGEHPPIL